MRWWWAMLVTACSGASEAGATERAEARTTATATATVTATATATPSDATTLHFAWPAPSEADVRVISEHDFGGGALVAARYRYRLAVARDERGYRVTRSSLELEQHEGSEALRLGNVIVQDVTQHAGDVHVDADGTHIAPTGGFEPIEAAARSVLSEAELDGPIVDAVIALDRTGWEPLNVVDFDTMIHEWNGGAYVLGVIQPASALPGVSATRILSRGAAACDGSDGAGPCVELIRTEQGERGADRVEQVYTLLAEPDTLRPHRFQHESRTDSPSAGIHYAETWTTTFAWR